MDFNKFSSDKEVRICAFGDLHYGSGFCDYDLVNKTIKKIKKDKDMKVILMGDIIENSSGQSVGTEIYNQKMNPTQQMDAIVELLEPIQKQILFYHSGNHEQRSFRYTGFDSAKSIAKIMKVPYCEMMAFTKYKVGTQNYNIYSWHGISNASNTAARINVLRKQAEVFDADLYLMGHVHDLYATTLPKRVVSDTGFKDVLQTYVLTGSFTKWDGSYAEQHGLKLSKLGAPLITLNPKEHKIGVNLEW